MLEFKEIKVNYPPRQMKLGPRNNAWWMVCGHIIYFENGKSNGFDICAGGDCKG